MAFRWRTEDGIYGICCKAAAKDYLIKTGVLGDVRNPDMFDFISVSLKCKVFNANRLQLHALVYDIFNWFRRLVLPKHRGKHLIDTVRLKQLKVAAKVVSTEDI